MKKMWIVPIVLLWMLATYQFVQGHQVDEKKVVEVLADVGAMEQMSVVEYYGEYRAGYLELTEREDYLRALAKQLGVTADLTVTRTYEEGRQETKIYKKTNVAKMTLRVITTETETQSEQYIIVNITLQEGMEQALGYRKKLEKLLEADTVNHRSSANIIGSYEGELAMEVRNEIADGILENLNAKVVSENREEKLYTIYAYTARISEYEMQGKRPVNINIAMYYSEAKDMTYVYAAIPIIGLDY